MGMLLTQALEKVVVHGAKDAVATKTWSVFLRRLIRACGTPESAALATYTALEAITPTPAGSPTSC